MEEVPHNQNKSEEINPQKIEHWMMFPMEHQNYHG